jgi:hypothetical protein
MKIPNTTTLSTYPVFPNWVFEGTVQLTNTMLKSIINDVEVLKESGNYTDTVFGWVTNKRVRQPDHGKNILKASQYVGGIFLESATNHFRFTNKNRKMEIPDIWLYGIKPNSMIPQSIEKVRWYQSVLFLQTADNGSSLYLDLHDAKFHNTPPNVQETTHYIKPETNKIVFFPAHIPWGFTPNHSMIENIVLCSNYTLDGISQVN